jgi:protein SCO1/2
MSSRTTNHLPARRARAAGVTAALAALLTAAAPLRAERPLRADQTPREMQGVGIEEHLGETIPLDLPFVDDEGRAITLADCFANERPVIVTMNYYRCPQLCTLTLNGLVDALAEIDWSAGREFDIVTVSIAPDETHELANVKKRVYLQQYDRETAAAGWHFLTGTDESIQALADALGFGFRRDEKRGDYAHSSSIMFITPDGRISRYMNDVVFAPRDVRLALVEASEGEIGSPMERLLLFTCYQFDPEAGSYAMSAVKIMRLAGAMTVVIIGLGLVLLWRRGPRRPLGRDLALGADCKMGELQS